MQLLRSLLFNFFLYLGIVNVFLIALPTLFLPSKFTFKTAPKPTNNRVSLVVLEGGVYAVIKYSGRLTDKNFQKHYEELKDYLIKDKINFIEPAIKATYDGPFTVPVLRRNEVMMKINYKESN